MKMTILLLCTLLAQGCSWNSPNVKVLSQVRGGEVLLIEADGIKCVAMRHKKSLVLRCLDKLEN